jgi:hypothetical protein
MVFNRYLDSINRNDVCVSRLTHALVRLYIDVNYAEGAMEVWDAILLLMLLQGKNDDC